MNSVDAARIFATLQGAYPYAKVDDITVSVWANSLDLLEFGIASQAAQRWIDAEEFFPTIAAFNGIATAIRREERDAAGEPPPAHSAIRCDGSGWFDRGNGSEPCPACNPWLRERWDSGQRDRHAKPPKNFVMPDPCRPSHAGETGQPVNRQRAMQLVLGGLREQLRENGLTPEQIDETVARRMPTVLAAVAGAPDAASPR